MKYRLATAVFIVTVLFFQSGCSSDTPESKPSVAEKAPAQPVATTSTTPASSGWMADDEFGYLDMSFEELKEQPLQELIEKKDLDRAKALVRRLLEEDPDPLEFHYFHGLVQFYAQEFGRAMDEFEYVLKQETRSGSSEFTQKITEVLKAGPGLVDQFLKEMATTEDSARLALITYRFCKLDWKFMGLSDDGEIRKFQTDFKEAEKRLGIELKRRDYYIIQSMAFYEKLMNSERTFWNFFYHGYFNFVKGWGSDARKSLDRALSVADTQDQVFFALQMLEKIPKKEESELDKLSSLDLSEDMIDEFLSKHSKELNDVQMAKVKDVIREGMKLKDKLEQTATDREKLNILKEFVEMAETRIDPKDFPPDIVSRVEQMKQKAASRFSELEEQIRVKEEALKG
ncbi:MAG: hypothetical protein H3C47_04770 [Candidatus Cloacimonetes bacterium]|nr:hypothetical protein [Candidatus Cloacimonadota bacterium]